MISCIDDICKKKIMMKKNEACVYSVINTNIKKYIAKMTNVVQMFRL